MIRVLVALCLSLLAAPVSAVEEVKPPAPAAAEEKYLPGVAITQGITEITGVAISPLLGVSTVGAWRYWKSPAEARPDLPWYAQPWAWGTGFVLLAMCFLKDSLGTAVPGVLKKPFDMVELFEDKASALVASGAFVPLVATEMAKHLEAEKAVVPAAAIFGETMAVINLSWLMVPGAVIAFLLVWVCSHAINVLIVLSPFSTVDAALKLLRTGLLAVIGLAYAVAPWLAAVLCVVIILVAIWLAPAAMRLAIFGARFAVDILLPWRGKRRATPERPHVFTLGRMSGLPPRTGGRLVLSEDGTAVFRYRRWCVLDERIIPLPEGMRHVEKGIFSPSLIHAGESSEATLLIFLPRYRGHEETLADYLKLHGVREHAMARGFAAVKGWIGGVLRRKPEPARL
ncbi:hypothetical protein OKA04_16715 [Luteolibacter flavescens]|uniref:Uncharacterized protein n=1 Tax=Luteolibacter flavescens TaxID=1859460 RepID=A0ABT3FS53_9BACT|nr:hypothetical protein [Luteolibacter flavescens]MCW1886382.1 hypothetical protein [Luteolibacter flavescens]